jgi:uncharacterized protein (TIRG00374 family)
MGSDLLSDSKFGIHPRRWLLLLVLIAFAALVASRFTDVQNLVLTLSQGQWQWVLAAILLQLLYYVLYAGMYEFGFYTVGVESRALELLPVLFAAIFINAVAPLGGAGGAAVFIDDAVQRGQSGARTAVGLVLVLLADLGTLIPFVITGAVFLFRKRDLHLYDAVVGTFFVLFIGSLTGTLVLARRQPDQLRRLLEWLQRTVNQVGSRLNRPDLLASDWAAKNASEFGEAAIAIAAHPVRLGFTLALALFLHVVNLAGLYTLFLAFQQPVTFGPLVAGFGMGIVFWVVSVVPQGIGVVEGIMSLVFSSLGIPRTKAVVISLAFRGVNFWLPLIVGFFLLRYVRSFGAGHSTAVAGERTENTHEPGGEPV